MRISEITPNETTRVETIKKMMAAIEWLPSSSITIIFFSLLRLLSRSISTPTYLYHFCFNDTMIANNTQYKTNLNTLLHSLSSNSTSSPTGFHSTKAGNTTFNTVYGLFLCRGDQNTTSCNDCVAAATTRDLPNTYCPNRKVAVIWYEECTVRYSNESFSGRMDQSPSVQFWGDYNITGNETRFTEILGTAMNDVVVQAANVDYTGRKFATKVVNVSSSITLYAMGECTPDISPSDCNLCLRIGIGQLRVMVNGSVMMPSCNVRYATSPFFGAVDGVVPSEKVDRREDEKASFKVISAIIVPVAAISLALLAIFIRHIRKKAKKNEKFGLEPGDKFTNVESLQYDLHTIQIATSYFSHQHKLGEGGFGTVYKGTLTNGQEIAVKRLSTTSGQGVQEFKNEVTLLAKLHHKNLVRLCGFCLAGEEKLLVYEYVPNKSLDYFLFDHHKREHLDWAIRNKIIVGVARGMLYLHEDSRLRIIHRDLKASNILLDVEMNPKIADFGMARIVGVDQTQENTKRVVGTYGYMSPEYAMHGRFSVKSDVYSFGVLLLEIICGQRNNTFYQSGYAEDLLTYAWKKWKEGMIMDIVDPIIRDSCASNEVMTCIKLGLLCVQQSANKRLTMATVMQKLDSHSNNLPDPEKPGFFINNRSIESNLSEENSKSMVWSVNDMSMTGVEPR
ncbi:Cysteine-rich receptor-like protein kinase 25 [Bienertia sinuspersici]